jgi:transcriptional regulator with XRE-family HTH domain
MADATPHELFLQLKQLLAGDSRSESEIARLSGVSQPSVSRYKNGAARQRWGKSFTKLCSFYGLTVRKHSALRPEYDRLLRDAIIDVWDGSDDQADVLLELLRSLKLVTSTSSPGARNG